MAIKYVAPNGSISNDGSIGSPWPVSKITMANVSPGDTIFLRGGNYYTAVNLTLSGTANAPITIKSYNSEIPIFDGQWDGVTHPLNTSISYPAGEFSGIFELNNCNYVILDGIRTRGSVGESFSFNSCSYLTLRNLQTHTSYGGSFIFNGTTNSTLDNSIGNYMSLAREWRGQTINGETINTWQSCCFVADDSNYITVTNTIIANGGGEGLVSGRKTHHVTYSHCISYNNQANGIYCATTQDAMFDACLIYNTDSHRTNYQPENGIVVNDEDQALSRGATFSNRNTIRNCIVVNVGNGIVTWSKASLQNLIIENNAFINCDYGIRILSPDANRPTPVGNKIHNNIIYSNRRSTTNTVSANGITWSNNLWYGCSRPASAAGSGDIVGSNPLLTDPDTVVNEGLQASEFFINNENSPAINNGFVLTGATTDYLGNARTGTPDIGPHEWNGITASTGGDEPSGWTGTNGAIWEVSDVYSGARCLRINNGLSSWISDQFAAVVGGRYRIKAHVKGQGNNFAQLAIRFYDGSSNLLTEGALVLNSVYDYANQYTKVQADFTAPANTQYAALSFQNTAAGTTDIYGDDFELKPVSGSNLLAESGVETISGWQLDGATWESGTAHTGTHSLRMVNSGSQKQARATWVSITPSTNYEVSAWLQGQASGNVALVVQWYSDSGGIGNLIKEDIHYVTGTFGSWSQVSKQFTAPVSAQSAYFVFRMVGWVGFDLRGDAFSVKQLI